MFLTIAAGVIFLLLVGIFSRLWRQVLPVGCGASLAQPEFTRSDYRANARRTRHFTSGLRMATPLWQ